MDIHNFIDNFAEQFETANKSILTAETQFRDLDEWSSLVALSVMAMVNEEYGVELKGEEMRNSQTIQQLYDIVMSRI